MTDRRQFLQTSMALAAGLLATNSFSQSAWPAKPINYLVAFPAGGTTDILARLVSQKLGAALGTTMVIENKGGAGGSVGSEIAARAPADGHHLLGGTISSHAINVSLYPKLGYDPLKDFKHIALIGVFPQFMVVRSDHPAKTVQDFLAMVKAKPGVVNYSSAGVGTSGFLAAEMLKQAMKLDMTHVPYKGPAPAMADLLGGRLDMVFTSSAASLVAAGKLRILAVTSEKRLSLYPDVPTLNEVSPKVQAVSWVGISAPAQTPLAITQRLEKEILGILQSPEMRQRLSDPVFGMTLTPLGSERFVEFIQSELNTWSPVIKAANIVMN